MRAQHEHNRTQTRQRPPRADSFRPRRDRRYIAFNKPFGVLSQFTPPNEGRKITLAAFGFPPGVYPVGRLDYDSEGLLLLSDDAALNKFLLDPQRGHPRTYWVQVERTPGPDALAQLRAGVVIDGRRTLEAGARLLENGPALPERPVPIRHRLSVPTAWLELTLREGRNRQVRRMTACVGHPTLRLFRCRIGDLDCMTLGLAPGEWRTLESGEIDAVLQHQPERRVARRRDAGR